MGCCGVAHSFWYLLQLSSNKLQLLKFSFFPPAPHVVMFCRPSLVQKIDAQAIEEFYGLTSDISKNSESGYILFYQSRD